ncbi:MAG: dihydrodipicolinate synthase family protein [Kiritimatiellales bacterium]
MEFCLKTAGLVAAPFTPMLANGKLNLAAVGLYAEYLHRKHVVGAFICGTTGEGMSLTLAERMQLAEKWVACAPVDLKIFVHVGHVSLADSCALAKHAADTGAGSIATMAPFFFKPDGVAGLADWCEQIAAAAPELPFYYYHIPSMTGFNIAVSDFLEIAAPRIPNLAGIKYTFEDLNDFERCLKFDNGRYDVLFGRDELLLSALRFGSYGAVGSTYNFAAPLYYDLIAAYRRGDLVEAEKLQAVAVAMIDALVNSGAAPTAAFKWLMSRAGVDCGPARRPLFPPTPEQIEKLNVALEGTGALKWIL